MGSPPGLSWVKFPVVLVVASATKLTSKIIVNLKVATDISFEEKVYNISRIQIVSAAEGGGGGWLIIREALPCYLCYLTYKDLSHG